MILAILYFLLSGSGLQGPALGELSTGHLKPQVKAAIADEARRERALHALSKVSGAIDGLNDRRSKQLDAFRKLVRDHGSTAEDFDRLFEQSAAEDVRRLDEIWALRQSVLEQATPDEWSAIMSGAKADAARADKGAKSTE